MLEVHVYKLRWCWCWCYVGVRVGVDVSHVRAVCQHLMPTFFFAVLLSLVFFGFDPFHVVRRRQHEVPRIAKGPAVVLFGPSLESQETVNRRRRRYRWQLSVTVAVVVHVVVV